VLEKSKKYNSDGVVIIMTGYASLDTAIQAIRGGAYDYIRKPFKLDEIEIIVKNACEKIALVRENRRLLQRLKETMEEMKEISRPQAKVPESRDSLSPLDLDYRISEMGNLFQRFLKKKMRIGVSGAYDFVDVRDVAEGHILAGLKGRSGEGYILSGEQISIPNLFSLLENITGIKAPGFMVPSWLARTAGILATPYYLLSKTKPLFTAYSIDVLNSNSIVSSEKARRELGFSPRSIRDSLIGTLNWFKEAQAVI